MTVTCPGVGERTEPGTHRLRGLRDAMDSQRRVSILGTPKRRWGLVQVGPQRQVGRLGRWGYAVQRDLACEDLGRDREINRWRFGKEENSKGGAEAC